MRVIVLCPGLLDYEASSSTHGNRFKSPIHEKAWQLDMKGTLPQKLVDLHFYIQLKFCNHMKIHLIFFRVDHVSKGLIAVIHDAKSGSVWLIANGKPPKEVPYSAVDV